MTTQEDQSEIYRERAYLTAHLAAVYPSVLVRGADPQWPDWPVLFVTLPDVADGQLTWHIAPEDVKLFRHVRAELAGTPGAPKWDGHTTQEKYTRLYRYTALVASR